MKNTNYLCIDDQQDRTVDVLLELLCSKDSRLVVERRNPVELKSQLKQISDASKAKPNFGLLLDLRLDQESTNENPKVPYRGPTLAQELRTRMAEKNIAPFPIVLWSITEKFVKSFDETSHDLFDAVYGKDDQITDKAADVALQMIALVEGYESIAVGKKSRSLSGLLGISEDSYARLEGPFLDEFKFFVEKKAVHEIASYILNSLIIPPGLLIDEKLLAARLGVDIQKSGDSWRKLLLQLNGQKYQGPFSNGWLRWWWFDVETWWAGLNVKQPNLRRIGATARAQILSDKFGLKLVSAETIEPGYSDKFFAICVATGLPLDPADGLRVAELNTKAWQDTAYVSGYAALNRIEKNKWRISLLDRDRFDRLKKK